MKKYLQHKKTQKIWIKNKRNSKNIFELEQRLSKGKKYNLNDDIERDIENLFNQSIDADYYKPVKSTSVFDHKNDYVEYESTRDKNKHLLPKE